MLCNVLRYYDNDVVMTLSVIVTLATCVTVSLQNHERIHVVSVQMKMRNKFDDEICPNKCTGTLLTKLLVLTVASCTEYTPRYELQYMYGTGGKVEGRQVNSGSDVFNTTANNVTGQSNDTKVRQFEVGDIQVFPHQPVNVRYTRIYANVSEKFVHPEFNPKTFVADLVLLKLNKRFHFMGEMPNIMRNNLLFLPASLYFRGTGKIFTGYDSIVKQIHEPGVIIYERTNNTELGIKYNRMFVQMNFTSTDCPVLVNGKLETDINWWSFFCLKYGDRTVGYDAESVLCDNDRGGPLYDVVGETDLPKLYGLFSHRFHPIYPVCSNQYCGSINHLFSPCKINSTMYYKFTSLIGRYTDWLNYTIERIGHIDNPVMATRICPTTEITTIEGVTIRTTNNIYYDVEQYDNNIKVMVSNKRVCSNQKNYMSSGWLIHRNQALSAVILVLMATARV